MKRNFKIIEEKSGISGEITFDARKEFLEVWFLEEENKIIIDKKENPYKKPPFYIMHHNQII